LFITVPIDQIMLRILGVWDFFLKTATEKWQLKKGSGKLGNRRKGNGKICNGKMRKKRPPEIWATENWATVSKAIDRIRR